MQLALIIICFFGLYLAIDVGRLFKGRINKEYLRHAWRKTAIWLVVLQLLTIFAAYAAGIAGLSLSTGLLILLIVQTTTAIAILLTTIINLRLSKPPMLSTNIASSELPALTVCIPARNETKDLEECLRSLISSTYPKLEILVLDDCSQERRTPDIIRSFAQDGVRFIGGAEPPESWLAKNFGYDQLADAANGELLLFCGVDSRFESETITNLVRLLTQSNKTMISILPRNIRKTGYNFGQNFIQPSRYAWELSLPRKILNRPPVLSTCWLISRDELEAAGGFNAISRKCVPESYFARVAAKNNDGYGFVVSNAAIGLSSTKSTVEQRATAIRTRYPQLHRRPELVALVSLALIAQMLLPILIFVLSLLTGHAVYSILSGITLVANGMAYSLIVNLTYRQFVLSGMFMLPVAAIYDICLLNYSMWQYEFGEVIWKDRNICIPIMQTFPQLPKV